MVKNAIKEFLNNTQYYNELLVMDIALDLSVIIFCLLNAYSCLLNALIITAPFMHYAMPDTIYE